MLPPVGCDLAPFCSAAGRGKRATCDTTPVAPSPRHACHHLPGPYSPAPVHISRLALATLLALAGSSAVLAAETLPFTERELAQGFRDGVVLAKPRA
ncbi:MAG: hypothetical protein FJ399_14750, partial [Verrucomicrobia bacterium]|nr:hypothetical protein [Verrucomicrobiota bacterium]